LAELKSHLEQLGADLVFTEAEIRRPETAKAIASLGKVKLAFNGVGGKSATNLARLLEYCI
jgi:NADPH:quinone reductase-like Zn-dependent oxidoreductase